MFICHFGCITALDNNGNYFKSLAFLKIFTICIKQQRLTILNRCTDWLCAQTVRHILTSFKMDEIIKKSLRDMNKSEQTKSML